MRILLAEPQEIYRRGIKAMLESNGFEVVGDTSNVREVIRLAKDLVPQMIIVEPCSTAISGQKLAKDLTEFLPGVRILFLTQHAEPRNVWEALRAGIFAYVLKRETTEVLLSACRAVAVGAIYLSPHTVESLLYAEWLDEPPDSEALLNSRDRQTLALIARGKATKEIAGLLGMNPKTAESLRRRLMIKVGVGGPVQLVRYAVHRESGGHS
jgi:DNA-binding NarL/FixJ family response regulator